MAKTYEPAEVEGVELAVSPRGAELHQEWPGTWLNAVMDETELLLALIDKDATGVRQTVWSGSPFQSVV